MEQKINAEAISAIENEVAKRQAEELKRTAEVTAKEVEDRVRKEMEAKIESEKLREQLQKQAEELEKIKTDTLAAQKAQQEAFEKRIAELEAQRKGLVSNQSPFDNKPEPQMIDKLDLVQVELESAEAFRRKFNLPDFYFEKTANKK